ncbi:putative rhamnosyl transferase [Sedimentitalea sp. HM32M-2]|uniref:putative rhamnosyl transferase n=1 Tax=Sedimentitalea sp. HM32M-2 TaxID=3351566 RepID=UPI0036318F76
MQVIGICRFSYPGTGGFQIQHDSLQERIDFLYAHERLEERFRFFETVTLPGIRAQFDPDFTFLIVIGDSLPAHHRKRLQALVADIPQAVIQSHPPGRHREVMQAAINSVRQPSQEPCLQFRLDDDDAVACSFVPHLREAAQHVTGLLRDNRCVAIDFNQGFIVRPGAAGIAAKAIHRPYWTAGLGLMFRPDVRLSVMNFGHHTVHKRMPTVTFSGENMMLRGHNDYNDSRQGPRVRQVPLKQLDADGELLFQMTYGIDCDHVRRVFSAPM